jgi:thymidylate kinase
MIFCITGCDCVGKTTCIEALQKELEDFTFFFPKAYNKTVEDKVRAGKDLRKLYEENKNVITERVPYLEDVVYNKLLSGEESYFKNSSLLEELDDYYIIYLHADIEELKSRLSKRGDEFVSEKDFSYILNKYEEELSKRKNVHRIDVTNTSIDEPPKMILEYIRNKLN